jgi:hypothetical protein
VQLWAHHSQAATYDDAKLVTIEGKIAQVSIRNPHSWVYVSVAGKSGQETWAIEWSGAQALNNANVTSRTLRSGDAVTVIGAISRDPNQHRLLMRSIERSADGWTWGRRPNEVVD